MTSLTMRFSATWVLLITVFFCSPVAAHAQDSYAQDSYAQDSYAQDKASKPTSPPTARNLVYGELLGAGGFYSLNYERRFARRWTARVGLSAYGAELEGTVSETTTLVLMPVMVNALIPGGTHNLELGAGPVFAYANATTEEYGTISGFDVGNVSANIAYRYQPPSGGFSFRAGLLPNHAGGSTNLWLSVGVGYAF